MKLEGKSAIVTGGGGKGIGAATALLFARHGAKVLISGTNEGRLVELVEKGAEEGLDIKYIVADVSNEEDCIKTVDTCCKACLADSTYFLITQESWYQV